MMRKYLSILFLTLMLLSLFGCKKYYVAVSQKKIDVNYLASIYVGTPDPRQSRPPFGQMLIVEWRIPKEILAEQPSIHLRVVYWDYTEKTFVYPISSRMSYLTYKLLNEEFEKKRGILTYSADLITADGKIYQTWKHQLWVNLIHIEDTLPSTSHELEPEEVFPPPQEEKLFQGGYPEKEEEANP